ncbi:hypothetical protein R3X26_14225 [Vibrio sp. TH_r3]|uniref:hypothetical protein n=1 Tax=Vibrio sp. TH_r3 TaxID=3082084 RepID=UPI0029559609|nr:hypothetical protein [Vibrio sp. TH_r3]MDV7105560.1 hypothetical protein [Vibrio sp. TH_r3]
MKKHQFRQGVLEPLLIPSRCLTCLRGFAPFTTDQIFAPLNVMSVAIFPLF